jgi:hypothetical protein
MTDPALSRPLLDEQILIAWAASQAAHDRRWRRLQWCAAAAAGVVIALALLDVVPWLPALVLLALPTLLAGLLINGERTCPACGKVPNGSQLRVSSFSTDYCMHCNHWLVSPHGRGPVR